MKPIDIVRQFEEETGYKGKIWNGGESYQDEDGQWITEIDYLYEYVDWLQDKLINIAIRIIDRLQAENKRYREALELVTDDLEEEIENRYEIYDTTKGDNKRRYLRDIESVKIAREALKEEK